MANVDGDAAVDGFGEVVRKDFAIEPVEDRAGWNGCVVGQMKIGRGLGVRVASAVVGTVLDVLICGTVFRVLTPRQVPTRQLWPGALAGGIGYSVLLTVGTGLVQHQLRHACAGQQVHARVDDELALRTRLP